MFGSYREAIQVLEGLIGDYIAEAQAQQYRDNEAEIKCIKLAISRLQQAEADAIHQYEVENGK